MTFVAIGTLRVNKCFRGCPQPEMKMLNWTDYNSFSDLFSESV